MNRELAPSPTAGVARGDGQGAAKGLSMLKANDSYVKTELAVSCNVEASEAKVCEGSVTSVLELLRLLLYASWTGFSAVLLFISNLNKSHHSRC